MLLIFPKCLMEPCFKVCVCVYQNTTGQTYGSWMKLSKIKFINFIVVHKNINKDLLKKKILYHPHKRFFKHNGKGHHTDNLKVKKINQSISSLFVFLSICVRVSILCVWVTRRRIKNTSVYSCVKFSSECFSVTPLPAPRVNATTTPRSNQTPSLWEVTA